MTVIVGVLCEDGVVVGSDSSATFGPTPQMKTIEQNTKKTFVVGNDLIFSGTGEVGYIQRLGHILGKLRGDQNFLRASRFDIAGTIARETLGTLMQTHAQPGRIGAIVAFACEGHFHLCEFGMDGFQPEFKTEHLWFTSMGGGQPITDPFLAFIARVLFQTKQPRIHEGILAATWALEHAIEVNPGGIKGPSQVAILKRDGPHSELTARLLDDNELAEHLNSVRGAEAHLGGYRQILSGECVVPQEHYQPSPPVPH